MPTKLPSFQITARDREIFAAVDLLPLTPAQLLFWSERFADPFPNLSILHRRLRTLIAAGLLNRFPLMIESNGAAPNYLRLTREGHQVLHGKDAAAPRKRAFSPIGPALHGHTHALSKFVIVCAVAAHREGVAFTELYPENTLVIGDGANTLRPDFRFSLVQGNVRRNFNVELDNSSEAILSGRSRDSISRKIRILDSADRAFDVHNPGRAVTLFVTTKSTERRDHILEAAATLASNPQRCLILAAYLSDVLSASNLLRDPCFLDHHGRETALLPKEASVATGFSTRSIADAPTS